jgi:N-acetylglutamate synthase-like GNAT family acetyltransferase
MSLSIRKAEQNDIKALCSLMQELSGHAISANQMVNRLEFIEESKVDSLFVCEKDRKIVGLLGFRIRENLEELSRFGEISAIVVNSNDRRKDVGRFMMDYAEKLAREFKCKGMWLVSGFGREKEAHKFYKQLGYQTTGYRFVKPFE